MPAIELASTDNSKPQGQGRFFKNAEIVAKYFKQLGFINQNKSENEFHARDFSQKLSHNLLMKQGVSFGDEQSIMIRDLMNASLVTRAGSNNASIMDSSISLKQRTTIAQKVLVTQESITKMERIDEEDDQKDEFQFS